MTATTDAFMIEWVDDTTIWNGRLSHPILEAAIYERENLTRGFMNIPGSQIKTLIESKNYLLSTKKFIEQEHALKIIFGAVHVEPSTEHGFCIISITSSPAQEIKEVIQLEARLLKDKLKKWRIEDDKWYARQSKKRL